MQAKALSVEMGFYEFMSRHDRSQITAIGLDRVQKIKINNKETKSDHKITIDDINNRLAASLNDNINCNNKNYKMYFISFDSKLWPCCFLNNGFFQTEPGKADILQQRLFDAYGDDEWNDISKHSIKEILDHEFYKNDLVDSWDSNIHGLEKGTKIHRCTEVCSVKKLEKLPIGNYKVI